MSKTKFRTHFGKDLPAKANRVLNIVLIGLLLIVVRVWHLSIIQHDEKLAEARRPQKKMVIEPAKRGTIRDRFNIPLAINKVQYNGAVLYSQIKQVPAVAWEKEGGRKVKKYQRKAYISALAQKLGEELHLEPERIEDEIHSKASLYNHIPYVLKEDLTEKEYYRLKMLEKDWPGIQTVIVPKRYYPHGKVGGDLVGYMGAISRSEYEGIAQEIQNLEQVLKLEETGDGVLPEESREGIKTRLQDLVEHAYSINDYVGKMGIEGQFEESLRGYHGKHIYAADARGNFLEELPGNKAPQSGQRLLLSISQELQEYAEELLIQNEAVRLPRISQVDPEDKKRLAKKEPWIKGGAIVAMDPISGDVLALASYPRFDPNDFIASRGKEESLQKNKNIRKWFETRDYVAEIWDQKRPLERERYAREVGHVIEETLFVDWNTYLDLILPVGSPIKKGLEKVKTVRNAAILQKHFQDLYSLVELSSAYPLINLLYSGEPHSSHGGRLPIVLQEELEEKVLKDPTKKAICKRALDPFIGLIPQNYDKVFLLDLTRLVVDPERIPDELMEWIGEHSLGEYRAAQAAWIYVEEAARAIAKDLFGEYCFKSWREKNQKTFLKEKRLEEKRAGVRYPKPYLDLLDRKEEEMFREFWEECRFPLLATFLVGEGGVQPGLIDSLQPYVAAFAGWERELKQGAHRSLCWNQAYWKLKEAAQRLPPSLVAVYLSSLRGFHELTRPLLGRYRHIGRTEGKQREKDLAAGFYPQYGYGFARSYAYRQATIQGSIFKVVTAYEALIQRYKQIEPGPYSLSTLNPIVIEDDSPKNGKFLGKDSAGKLIPQLYKGGRIPRSLNSGLGKMDVIKALEVSSNPYFSLLASDCLKHPDDLSNAAKQFSFGSRTGIDLAAEIAGHVPSDLSYNRSGLYSMAIGQHSLVVTPLQTAVMLAAIANGGKILKPRIVNLTAGKDDQSRNAVSAFPSVTRWEIFLPNAVRHILLEGMRRVVKKTSSSSLWQLSELYEDYPEAIGDLLELKEQLVGKTSTAESMEHLDLDLKFGTLMYNHVGFGAILYEPEPKTGADRFTFQDKMGRPELVVVAYLRYGARGKEALPIAAQVAKKWREIKKKQFL